MLVAACARSPRTTLLAAGYAGPLLTARVAFGPAGRRCSSRRVPARRGPPRGPLAAPAARSRRRARYGAGDHVEIHEFDALRERDLPYVGGACGRESGREHHDAVDLTRPDLAREAHVRLRVVLARVIVRKVVADEQEVLAREDERPRRAVVIAHVGEAGAELAVVLRDGRRRERRGRRHEDEGRCDDERRPAGADDRAAPFRRPGRGGGESTGAEQVERRDSR